MQFKSGVFFIICGYLDYYFIRKKFKVYFYIINMFFIYIIYILENNKFEKLRMRSQMILLVILNKIKKYKLKYQILIYVNSFL